MSVVSSPSATGPSAPPRFLLIGNDKEWAIERSFARAFDELGVRTTLWDWSELLEPLPSNLQARRFAWPLLSSMINRRLPERIRADAPDVVLVFKGLLVERDTVDAIRRQGSFVACVNTDNPFNPSVTSSQPQLRRALSSWDCYFTWGKFLVERLYSIGARRVEYLPFAWDPVRHPPGELSPTPSYAVSFIGSFSRHRETWLSHLLDLDLSIWGGGWDRAGPVVRAHVRGGGQTGADFACLVRDSAVSLNVLDPFNVPGHNMRTFEIPGCGGLQLSTASSEVADLFEPGKEMLDFRTFEEMRAQVSWALTHPAERQDIAMAGNARAAGATYSARAERVFQVWKEMSGR